MDRESFERCRLVGGMRCLVDQTRSPAYAPAAQIGICEIMRESLRTKILLVEDNKIAAMLSTMSLNNYGYSVEHALCGEEAVVIITGNREFAMILMDIDLGAGIDGFEAAQEIQKISSIPIVFLSSHDEPRYIKRARQISHYGYVMKDGSHYILLEQVIRIALSVHELYEMHKLQLLARKYRDSGLRNSLIITAICDSRLKYSWINNPHPDFALLNVLGKTDIQIVKNEGTEKLHDFKKEIFNTGERKSVEIGFPLSAGELVYEVLGLPMLLDNHEITGVKTISVVK